MKETKEQFYRRAMVGHSFVVANFKPSHETARNLYADDKELIERLAAELGYKYIGGKTHRSYVKAADLRNPEFRLAHSLTSK